MVKMNELEKMFLFGSLLERLVSKWVINDHSDSATLCDTYNWYDY